MASDLYQQHKPLSAIVIQQPTLGIHHEIRFNEPGEAHQLIHHAELRSTAAGSLRRSFGRCVFMDNTFLPGTLTFQLFGHEIELLPRVMMIDHEERSWRSASCYCPQQPSAERSTAR